jgi:hypothetical protein
LFTGCLFTHRCYAKYGHTARGTKVLFLLVHLLLTLMLVLLIVMLLLQLLIWSTDRGIPRFGGQTIKFNDLECRPSNSMS